MLFNNDFMRVIILLQGKFENCFLWQINSKKIDQEFLPPSSQRIFYKRTAKLLFVKNFQGC